MNPALLALILTQAQANWLNVAYNEGSKYGIPRYTQAIILVESSACLQRRGDDGRSLGCGQLQIATARKYCKCSISVERLVRDERANIHISAAFLSACFERFWPDKRRSIFCFNRGIPAASKATDYQVTHSRYVYKVESAVRALEGVKVDTQ